METRIKICPRCKNNFACQADDISACACASVVVSNETKSFLANTFYDCLCTDCLAAINRQIARQKEYPFPGRGGDLMEGVHYYKEDVYRVFTEFYLMSRGYCCRSGCRHCPYGFKKRHAE